MNPIDNIMALADEYAWVKGLEEIDPARHALRAAIEKALVDAVQEALHTRPASPELEREINEALGQGELELQQILQDLRFHGLTLVKTVTNYPVLRSDVLEIQNTAPQPKQEPVACRHEWFRTGAMDSGQRRCIHCGKWEDTAPQPQREWVTLTDEEIIGWVESGDYNVITNDWASHIEFARAIEAKLREKNGI